MCIDDDMGRVVVGWRLIVIVIPVVVVLIVIMCNLYTLLLFVGVVAPICYCYCCSCLLGICIVGSICPLLLLLFLDFTHLTQHCPLFVLVIDLTPTFAPDRFIALYVDYVDV